MIFWSFVGETNACAGMTRELFANVVVGDCTPIGDTFRGDAPDGHRAGGDKERVGEPGGVRYTHSLDGVRMGTRETEGRLVR